MAKRSKRPLTRSSARTKRAALSRKGRGRSHVAQRKRTDNRRGKVNVTRYGVDAIGPEQSFAIPFKAKKGDDLKALARRALGQETRLPRDIVVGKRYRIDKGDIKGLALSINARGGVIQPLAIDKANKLIDGERRLIAWQHALCRFRKEPIPVHVVDIDSLIAGEYDANAQRKDFTLSEAVAIKRAIEPRLKVAAKERQRAHGGTAPGKAAPTTPDLIRGSARRGDENPASSAKGRAGDQVAKLVGKDRRTLEKAQKVVEAAERDPERFGKLKDDMDKSGRADAPYRRLKVMEQAAEIRSAPPPLPGRGPYRGGIIDPPWPAEPEEDDPERLARGYYPYPTMSLAELKALDVGSILHGDAVVGLWVTNFHLALGHHLPLLEAWGLKPVTIRTWVKDRMGRGSVLRGQTEHLVIARRGKPVIEVAVPTSEASVRHGNEKPANLTTFFHAAVNAKAHSQKPQKAYDDFARLVASERYFSLFETVERGPLWDGHGDQVAALPARDRTPSQRFQAFPQGVPGHVIRMHNDATQHIATCECGCFEYRYPFAADPELAEAKKCDAAIEAHWCAVRDAAAAAAELANDFALGPTYSDDELQQQKMALETVQSEGLIPKIFADLRALLERHKWIEGKRKLKLTDAGTVRLGALRMKFDTAPASAEAAS